MSSRMVVRPEGFEKAVLKALAEYGDKATEIVDSTMTKTARQTASALKGSAPGGEYGAGWTHKAQKGGAFNKSETVYNRQGQLTHLLEKPHPTGHGGRYPKNVDYTGTMARVEEEYTNKYMEEVLSKL